MVNQSSWRYDMLTLLIFRINTSALNDVINIVRVYSELFFYYYFRLKNNGR